MRIVVRDEEEYIVELAEVSREDGRRVGGKNASLREMIRRLENAGVRVPEGFATTAAAYRRFLDENWCTGIWRGTFPRWK